MHAAGMRRVPAERVRHAKRLGHVQAGSGHPFPVLAGSSPGNGSGTATTLSPLLPTSIQSPTPTNHSSSGAPSATSSSSSLTSTTASPTSSTPSTNTQLLTPSSSPSTPSTGLTFTLPDSSSIPTSTPSPQAHTGATQHSGLSGGAIAGIIAGSAIVGAALIVFLIRKACLRRRERKRISWTGAPGLGAADESKSFPDVTERRTSFASIANIPQRTVPSPFATHGQSMYSNPVHMQPPPVPTYAVPIPPPVTYNNAGPVAAYPTQPASLAYGPGNPAAMTHVPPATNAPLTASTMRAQRAPMEATVRCTFVPSLPDELSITTGERIFVLERYDDGWDLCANARGERGMVPRECLEQAPFDQPEFDWRNGRASSLNPDGQRY